MLCQCCYYYYYYYYYYFYYYYYCFYYYCYCWVTPTKTGLYDELFTGGRGGHGRKEMFCEFMNLLGFRTFAVALF